MKRLIGAVLTAAFLFASLPSRASAQVNVTPPGQFGPTTVTTAGAAISASPSYPANWATCTLDSVGTWTGTINFTTTGGLATPGPANVYTPNSTTPVTSTTSNGVFTASVASGQTVTATLAAGFSGSITWEWKCSTAPLSYVPGSGGTYTPSPNSTCNPTIGAGGCVALQFTSPSMSPQAGSVAISQGAYVAVALTAPPSPQAPCCSPLPSPGTALAAFYGYSSSATAAIQGTQNKGDFAPSGGVDILKILMNCQGYVCNPFTMRQEAATNNPLESTILQGSSFDLEDAGEPQQVTFTCAPGGSYGIQQAQGTWAVVENGSNAVPWYAYPQTESTVTCPANTLIELPAPGGSAGGPTPGPGNGAPEYVVYLCTIVSTPCPAFSETMQSPIPSPNTTGIPITTNWVEGTTGGITNTGATPVPCDMSAGGYVVTTGQGGTKWGLGVPLPNVLPSPCAIALWHWNAQVYTNNAIFRGGQGPVFPEMGVASSSTNILCGGTVITGTPSTGALGTCPNTVSGSLAQLGIDGNSAPSLGIEGGVANTNPFRVTAAGGASTQEPFVFNYSTSCVSNGSTLANFDVSLTQEAQFNCNGALGLDANAAPTHGLQLGVANTTSAQITAAGGSTTQEPYIFNYSTACVATNSNLFQFQVNGTLETEGNCSGALALDGGATQAHGLACGVANSQTCVISAQGGSTTTEGYQFKYLTACAATGNTLLAFSVNGTSELSSDCGGNVTAAGKITANGGSAVTPQKGTWTCTMSAGTCSETSITVVSGTACIAGYTDSTQVAGSKVHGAPQAVVSGTTLTITATSQSASDTSVVAGNYQCM